MISTEAAKEVPTSFRVMLLRYRETGNLLFVFKKVIGGSMAFQYSRKFRIREEMIPGSPRGNPT